MDGDFPAAHSMDTDWFAVDKCGHVALFKSGEAGAVPVDAKILIGPDGGEDELGEEIFGPRTEEMEENDDLVYPDTKAAGVFEYEHEEENWMAGPYRRLGRPEKPVTLEDLPQNVEEKLKDFRFADFCFLEKDRIQPVDHAECASWSPGFLDLAGKTIRPLPGQEEEYRAAYDSRGQDGSDDGITWEPPKKWTPPKTPPPPPPSPGFMGWLKRFLGGK